MDLSNLKWTKNVKHKDGELWAYPDFNPGDLFKLAWKDNNSNTDKPDKDDLILLRQRGYVTHLVKILDYKHERESWEGIYNIYRVVESLWTINFNHPKISILLICQNMIKFPKLKSAKGSADLMNMNMNMNSDIFLV